MDKIEKIKEWVNKQKKEELARNSIGVITGKALFVDANELLSFLDTLSEEPDKSLEEFPNGKFVFPKYLYARTKDNKTIDISYAPQSMEAVEYVRNDFIEQGQPKEDLEEEVKKYWNAHALDYRIGRVAELDFIFLCARHFAEWLKSQMPMPEDTVLFNKGVQEGRRLEREDMMHDALEGVAHPDDCEIWVNLIGYGYKFNDGDKVRIVVLKEEE